MSYLSSEEYKNVEQMSLSTNENFYKKYLTLNKDALLTCLHVGYPQMIDSIGKIGDVDYIFNILYCLKDKAKTPEEIENFSKDVYNYLNNELNLKVDFKFIMDFFYSCDNISSLEDILYNLRNMVRDFIKRDEIDISLNKLERFYNLKGFEDFYLENEEILLKKILEQHRLTDLLEKFPLSPCVYAVMKNGCYAHSGSQYFTYKIRAYIIDIEEKLKVTPKEYEIMLLLGYFSSFENEKSLAVQYQKYLALKPAIEELKLAYPRYNEAFIVYSLLKKSDNQ